MKNSLNSKKSEKQALLMVSIISAILSFASFAALFAFVVYDFQKYGLEKWFAVVILWVTGTAFVKLAVSEFMKYLGSK